MTLSTSNYNGTTINQVIKSLESDEKLMDFIQSQNLPGGDILEAIASAMVYNDPPEVYVDKSGKVTTAE